MMFLISKIVRGKRVLEEAKKQEEKSEAAAASREQPGSSGQSLRKSSCAVAETLRLSMQERVAFEDGSGLVVNKFHKRAIKYTWLKLRHPFKPGRKILEIFETVFEMTLRKQPDMKRVFYARAFGCYVSIRAHARLLVDLIDTCTAAIATNNYKLLDEQLRKIGRAHHRLRSMGFLPEYWEAFGALLAETIYTQDAVRDMPGASRAWLLAVAIIIDKIRSSFGEGSISRRRSALFKQASSSMLEDESEGRTTGQREEASKQNTEAIHAGIGSAPLPRKKIQFVEQPQVEIYRPYTVLPRRKLASALSSPYSAEQTTTAGRRQKRISRCISVDSPKTGSEFVETPDAKAETDPVAKEQARQAKQQLGKRDSDKADEVISISSNKDESAVDEQVFAACNGEQFAKCSPKLLKSCYSDDPKNVEAIDLESMQDLFARCPGTSKQITY